MTSLYLSRARLKREPSISALAPLLLPNDNGDRAEATHRLVWSMFSGDESASRDFLYREIAPSRAGDRPAFMILSRRAPDVDSALFDVETKDFEINLTKGDRLRFSLRANATVAIVGNGKPKRADIVMNALYKLPPDERSAARQDTIIREGRAWLIRQSEASGFKLIEDEDEEEILSIDGYDTWHFKRLGRNGRISVMDCEGLIQVTDPSVFARKLSEGFGRAKSYGCGLMLIRRA